MACGNQITATASAMSASGDRRRAANPKRLAAAIACKIPKKMKASGMAIMVAMVIAQAAAISITHRRQNARQPITAPCASHRLTPARNRKLPAVR